MGVIIELIDLLESKLAKTMKGKKALEDLYSAKTKKRIDAFQKAIDAYNKNYEEFHSKPSK